MPLDRPRLRPFIGPDGKNDRKWLEYFDDLAANQTTTTTFEAETLFKEAPANFSGDVRRAKANVSDLLARVKALEFLDG